MIRGNRQRATYLVRDFSRPFHDYLPLENDDDGSLESDEIIYQQQLKEKNELSQQQILPEQ